MRLREKLLFGGGAVILFLASITGYEIYKMHSWSEAQAVVSTIQKVCVYYRSTGRRSFTYKRPFCEDGDAAARLLAGGYKLRWEEALIRATYEAEPGKKVEAILRPRWTSAVFLRWGSVIDIRYSSRSPTEAEMVGKGEGILYFFFAMLLGLLVVVVLTVFLLISEESEQAKTEPATSA